MTSKYSQIWYRSVLCAAVLAGAACSQQQATTTAEPVFAPDSPTGSAQAEVSNSGNIPVSSGSLNGQISAAVADLSSFTGVAADEITVIEVRHVNWRSGALGCPEKGKGYTQAIVPGVLFLLQANGKTYRYHASAAGVAFHCPDARAQAPSMSPGDA